MIRIYTDGGCVPNPGFGAWGFVVIDSDDTILFESVGVKEQSTNNQMELEALYRAFKVCEDNNIESPFVFTDSIYVKQGITQWISKWFNNGWKTATKQDVKNKEQWVNIHRIYSNIKPSFQWVKGHSDDKWNNYVDELCSKAINESKTK